VRGVRVSRLKPQTCSLSDRFLSLPIQNLRYFTMRKALKHWCRWAWRKTDRPTHTIRRNSFKRKSSSKISAETNKKKKKKKKTWRRRKREREGKKIRNERRSWAGHKKENSRNKKTKASAARQSARKKKTQKKREVGRVRTQETSEAGEETTPLQNKTNKP
jgi:hypothetical protein